MNYGRVHKTPDTHTLLGDMVVLSGVGGRHGKIRRAYYGQTAWSTSQYIYENKIK